MYIIYIALCMHMYVYICTSYVYVYMCIMYAYHLIQGEPASYLRLFKYLFCVEGG